MERLSRHNLLKYLRSIQKATNIQNSNVEPEKMTGQEWAEFCLRDGAARLLRRLSGDMGWMCRRTRGAHIGTGSLQFTGLIGNNEGGVK